MPTAIHPTLSEDQVDDLLYLARVGETSELESTIAGIAKHFSVLPHATMASAIDPQSGNGLLHMACANGHTGLLAPHSNRTMPDGQSLANIFILQSHSPAYFP